jgi:hypothetical protein
MVFGALLGFLITFGSGSAAQQSRNTQGVQEKGPAQSLEEQEDIQSEEIHEQKDPPEDENQAGTTDTGK